MTERDPQELAQFVRELTQHLGVACEVAVSASAEGGPLAVTIAAPEAANLLIGKDGQNLRALEHIVRMAWVRRDPAGRAITVDINDYRKTKTAELVVAVHETARRVRDTKRPEALDPMSSYERRVVHTELATYHDLATESIGVEPHRRVVIKPL